MKVNLFISKDIGEAHVDIYTDCLTDNISKAISIMENDDSKDMIAVRNGDDISFLEFDDIFMFRVEDKRVKVYTQDSDYLIKKPLYKVEEELNHSFVRISKTTIVNLKKVERVTPSIRGMMFIQLKNGLKDNISRKYLPEFKEALGL